MKLAVTEILEDTHREQTFPSVEAQPDQPPKVNPEGGVAVKVTQALAA
jgi:hypothetical protein